MNYDEVAAFCQKIIDCKGTTLFTGVGKSAFIAKKVCQTLVSTGTRSIWLAPVDALHGDIGNVSPGDVVVMLSKSGTTEELITLVPYAKAKGGFIVAATNNAESKLAKMCDMHVTVPSNGGGRRRRQAELRFDPTAHRVMREASSGVQTVKKKKE